MPGLGDSAYAAANSGSGGTDFLSVVVLKGDVQFTIEVAAILYPPTGMGQEEKRANLIAMARAALGRL